MTGFTIFIQMIFRMKETRKINEKRPGIVKYLLFVILVIISISGLSARAGKIIVVTDGTESQLRSLYLLEKSGLYDISRIVVTSNHQRVEHLVYELNISTEILHGTGDESLANEFARLIDSYYLLILSDIDEIAWLKQINPGNVEGILTVQNNELTSLKSLDRKINLYVINDDFRDKFQFSLTLPDTSISSVKSLFPGREYSDFELTELAFLVFYFPEIFSVSTHSFERRIHNVGSLQSAAATYIVKDILQGSLNTDACVAFASFPVDKSLYTYDVRARMDEMIKKNGIDEFKACVLTDEFHGHLGIYSILGAKMGILAREYFNVGIDRLTVVTQAGNKPPVSCLNDGLQVSTGATLGQGTISIHPEGPVYPAATFTLDEKSITIQLKEEYVERVKGDINKGLIEFGITSEGYWNLVRQLAIEYWTNWHRNEIFIITRQ